MKLNLLPTTISKEGQQKTAVILSILLAALGIAACVGMILISKGRLDSERAKAQEIQPQAEQAVRTAEEADQIIQKGTGIQRNSFLAKAMMDHNSVYPNLYREVLSYVPKFFRVTSISAAPVNESTCTVTMTGVIQTYEQYANLMLALLRIPTATNVTRSGYQNVDRYVPNISEEDQIGIPIRPGESRLPSNPLERLDQMIAANATPNTGFDNVGGFGAAGIGQKGAMPNWSEINVTVTLISGDVNGKMVSRDIRTPDPRATLAQQTGAPAAPPAPTPNPGAQTPPAGGGVERDEE